MSGHGKGGQFNKKYKSVPEKGGQFIKNCMSGQKQEGYFNKTYKRGLEQGGQFKKKA